MVGMHKHHHWYFTEESAKRSAAASPFMGNYEIITEQRPQPNSKDLISSLRVYLVTKMIEKIKTHIVPL